MLSSERAWHMPKGWRYHAARERVFPCRWVACGCPASTPGARFTPLRRNLGLEMSMNRQKILDLYPWAPGICFRHPGAGEQPTAVVAAIHTRVDGEVEVRACADCVLAMEGARRARAVRAGREYEPGHLGEPER